MNNNNHNGVLRVLASSTHNTNNNHQQQQSRDVGSANCKNLSFKQHSAYKLYTTNSTNNKNDTGVSSLTHGSLISSSHASDVSSTSSASSVPSDSGNSCTSPQSHNISPDPIGIEAFLPVGYSTPTLQLQHHHQQSASSASPPISKQPTAQNSFMTANMLKPELAPRATVLLPNADLWKKFHRLTNEMENVSKNRGQSSRSCSITLYTIFTHSLGLEPKVKYALTLQMQLIGKDRWKFQAGGWSKAGQDDAPDLSNEIYHHDGPAATGEFWMKETISFDRAKLTNRSNTNDQGGSLISLASMHKYQPVLRLYKIAGTQSDNVIMPILKFEPPECRFIAVTAYQNDSVIKLKVEHNPFAKGFRDGSSRKRSFSTSPTNSLDTQPTIPFKIPAVPYAFNCFYPTTFAPSFPLFSPQQVSSPVTPQQSPLSFIEQFYRQQQIAQQVSQLQASSQHQQQVLQQPAAAEKLEQPLPLAALPISSAYMASAVAGQQLNALYAPYFNLCPKMFQQPDQRNT